MKIIKQNIKLPALSGERTIAKADKVFTGWLDSDFKNWGTDEKGIKTEAMEVATLEVEKDGTLKDIFGSVSSDLDSLVLTQDQIIEYVEKNKDLFTDWYTFFLFKVGSEFFVASVCQSGGRLGAGVGRFSRDYVWNADRGLLRVVVPQLALKNSDSLTLAIETVKKAGYIIYKQL